MSNVYTVEPKKVGWPTYSVEFGGIKFMDFTTYIGTIANGSVEHSVILEMINRGAPMLLVTPAHDMDGEPIFEDFTVFVAVELQQELYDEFEKLKTEEDWTDYKPPTYVGPPSEHDLL